MGKLIIPYRVYMTWICTLGSSILGNWIWWFYLLVSHLIFYLLVPSSHWSGGRGVSNIGPYLTHLQVPGFGVYKLVMTFKPILAMVLPSIFGPSQTGANGAVPAAAGAQAGAAAPADGESKRQAKLRARMEKGDKRVQSVQTTRQR